jgi:hypothetical protein
MAAETALRFSGRALFRPLDTPLEGGERLELLVVDDAAVVRARLFEHRAWRDVVVAADVPGVRAAHRTLKAAARRWAAYSVKRASQEGNR